TLLPGLWLRSVAELWSGTPVPGFAQQCHPGLVPDELAGSALLLECHCSVCKHPGELGDCCLRLFSALDLASAEWHSGSAVWWRSAFPAGVLAATLREFL